jgi:hypothetical protein
MDKIMAQSRNKKGQVDRPITASGGPSRTWVLPQMPVQVSYSSVRLAVSFENQIDEIVFRIQTGRVQEFPVNPTLEPYRLREVFLAAKNPGEAIEFLGLSGFFLDPEQDGYGRQESAMTWAEFQEWQELIRRIRLQGFLKLKKVPVIDDIETLQLDVPASMDHLVSRVSSRAKAWLAGIPHGIVIEPYGDLYRFSRDLPAARINVSSTLEAILATIYLDRLNGRDYALCGLKDCGKIYEVTSKHAREYCSQACAHKASVRRRRALVAQEKAKRPKATQHKKGTKQ